MICVMGVCRRYWRVNKSKSVTRTAKKEIPAKCPSCPQTVNLFSHFQPDGVTNEGFGNTALAFEFFTETDKLFPLYLPDLEKMSELAFAGKQTSASILVKIATNLSFQIAALNRQQPQVMREIARKTNVWPIVGCTKTVCEMDVQTQLEELELGKDIRHIDISFRKAGGCDANYPARRWAKAAVNCINTTRFFQRRLASEKSSADIKLGRGIWKRGVEPTWVSVAKDLPDFSNQSRPKWAEVIRKMIREELPKFHLRPEWEMQRNTCKANARSAKGPTDAEIQCAILDDIISALKTITPNETNQSAENALLNFSTESSV
jgi:ribosomal protein L31E